VQRGLSLIAELLVFLFTFYVFNVFIFFNVFLHIYGLVLGAVLAKYIFKVFLKYKINLSINQSLFGNAISQVNRKKECGRLPEQ